MSGSGSNARVSPVRLFIAHSWKDRRISGKIARALKQKGYEVWYDEWSIKVGQSITKKITEALTEGDYLVLVLSKNSIRSAWVEKEITMSIVLETEKKSIFILPVKIDNCKIPLILSDRKYSDFRKGFNQGMNELVDAIMSPRPVESPIEPQLPPRQPNVGKMVDSFAEMPAETLRKKVASLQEDKKRVILEIMDRLSMGSYENLPNLRYLFQALDFLMQEDGRPSVKLFEIFFREFAFRSLYYCKQDLLRLLAKYVAFSEIREWIQEQRLLDYFVSEFENSGTYVSGESNSQIVANLGPILSESQFKRVVEAAASNSQVYESWGAPQHLRRLFFALDKWVTADQRERLGKLKLR